VVERANPTLRLDLALLGLELRWFDEGSEEESAILNRLRIGFDESYCNWADFSTILSESVQVREAIMALLTSASDPRRQESRVEILKACCTTIDVLYSCDTTGHPRQNQHNRTRHGSLVTSNLLPVLLRAMEPSITGAIPVNFETHLQLRMAFRWCCSIDSPDHSHLEQSCFILRFLHDLATRPVAHWNEMGLFLEWTQAMLKSHWWCWPLLLSKGVISTILPLTQSPRSRRTGSMGRIGRLRHLSQG